MTRFAMAMVVCTGLFAAGCVDLTNFDAAVSPATKSQPWNQTTYPQYGNDLKQALGKPGNVGEQLQVVSSREEAYTILAGFVPPGSDFNAAYSSLKLNGFHCQKETARLSCESIVPSPRWTVILANRDGVIGEITVVTRKLGELSQ
jgi:hypothetical protein